jgi:signal transduction histidine kinase
LILASVNELCQNSLSFVKQQAHQKNIRLSYQIEDVTEALNVDERPIRQVLINLLNNAVKFISEGGRVRLEVRGWLQEQTVSFSIIDNSIGIAPLVQLIQSLILEKKAEELVNEQK